MPNYTRQRFMLYHVESTAQIYTLLYNAYLLDFLKLLLFSGCF